MENKEQKVEVGCYYENSKGTYNFKVIAIHRIDDYCCIVDSHEETTIVYFSSVNNDLIKGKIKKLKPKNMKNIIEFLIKQKIKHTITGEIDEMFKGEIIIQKTLITTRKLFSLIDVAKDNKFNVFICSSGKMIIYNRD